ncbi:MAG TPA: DUF4331 domain-containing protein [Streptosporangiaceae bacterium]|jgi:hypothetical protein
MSSHREAPEISKDPVADSTDVYAFVSPDKPDTVTLIANYVPLQTPAGGPNFYEFGEDVLYEIHIDTRGNGEPDITYQFRFTTHVGNPNTFLYNTAPITSLSSPAWNRKQFYSVTRRDRWGVHKLGTHLASPPCNIGPLSTPHYAALAHRAIHQLSDGSHVFAGQRAEGFYVDLGSIFDLLDLRPIQELNIFAHALGLGSMPGVNTTKFLNVHSIALQVPISDVTEKHRPVIGVWTTASRRRVGIRDDRGGDWTWSGPETQVSRLGNPLVNEVIIAMGKKDFWNTQEPEHDKQFAQFYAHPELAGLIAAIYAPNFPHLQAAITAGTVRADLEAILLTGIPAGIIPTAPTFTNFTGSVQADLLRLNTAIPPTTNNPNPLGVLGGDLAGFPNGRRVFDDVVTVELRAIAGLTLPLVDPSFTPDAAVGAITDGLTDTSPGGPYLHHFPYLGLPYDGYHHPSA